MAIPDTYTYTFKNVCTELQTCGSISYSANTSLSELFLDAPDGGFDPSYSGTTSCLRNFRKYSLIDEIYCAIRSPIGGGLGYDCDNDYMWAAYGGTITDAACTMRINPSTGVVDCICTTYRAENLVYDNNGYMWFFAPDYNCSGKINVSTGTITTYSGYVGFPRDMVFDGTYMWTADYCSTGDGRYSRITSGGTRTSYSCNCFCRVMGISFDGTNIWLASAGNNSVGKINPSDGSVIACYSLGTEGCCPAKIYYNGTDMWTKNMGCNTFSKITLGGTVSHVIGTLNTINYGNWGVTAGENVWVTNSPFNSLTKISPSGELRIYCNCCGSGVAYSNFGVDTKRNRLWFQNDGSVMAISKIAVP